MTAVFKRTVPKRMDSLRNLFMSSRNGIRKVSGKKSDWYYESVATPLAGGLCSVVLLRVSQCSGDRDLLSWLERGVVDLVDGARRRFFQREWRRRQAHLYGRRAAIDSKFAVGAYTVHGRRRCVGAFGSGRRRGYRLAGLRQ